LVAAFFTDLTVVAFVLVAEVTRLFEDCARTVSGQLQ